MYCSSVLAGAPLWVDANRASGIDVISASRLESTVSSVSVFPTEVRNCLIQINLLERLNAAYGEMQHLQQPIRSYMRSVDIAATSSAPDDQTVEIVLCLVFRCEAAP